MEYYEYYLVKVLLRDGTSVAWVARTETGDGAPVPPEGGFVKRAHCYECACMIRDFGLTEAGAYEFNHGESDKVFFRA